MKKLINKIKSLCREYFRSRAEDAKLRFERSLMSNTELHHELEDHLHKIDWHLACRGCDHYSLIDSKDDDTDFMLFGKKIELQPKFNQHEGFLMYIDLRSCVYDLLKSDDKEDDCLTLSPIGMKNDGVFLMLFKHIEREKK